ncbi:MAG TPA: cache domain-containing protein [Spirochaetia bacterium]|nr:cache domain-containing protein [Spirochaetia bacterium]
MTLWLPEMVISTRFRLIASFLAVSLLVGGLSLLVGVQLIYRAVLREAQTRVSQDLNSAREIYDDREKSALLALTVATGERAIRNAAHAGMSAQLPARLAEVAAAAGLDFVTIVSSDGTRLASTGSLRPAALDPVASLALKRRAAVSGTVVLSAEQLAAEDPALAERARIQILPTPRAAPRADTEETAGLAVCAAVPLFFEDGTPCVLYGGTLLSRNEDIVDRIRDTVFRQERYGGQLIGTATIFFRDLRISTNVRTPSGARAIGTRLSAAVTQKVLERGERWSDRAFVVNDWYVTAYEPIDDIFGTRVGVLYVGVLEARYADIRTNALLVFVVITLIGIAAAIALGSVLGYFILKPVHQLIDSSRRVSAGDLTPQIGPVSRSEIGILQKTFADMLSAIRMRSKQLLADQERQLLQSEKQASIGRLASGIAHEINNPLTGVLTFTHMLLRRTDLDEAARKDLTTIAQSTERVRTIVKGLLDFSRQTQIAPEPTDVNRLIVETMELAAHQALIKGVRFCFTPSEGLPSRTLDRNQMQSVLLNIFINAIDATDKGGHIDVSTSLSMSPEAPGRRGIEIQIADTGNGIPAEILDRIFDPFFTTKEVGKGTGLGLSVSLGIVERHGGTIHVASRPGQGSTFVIHLPLAAAE